MAERGEGRGTKQVLPPPPTDAPADAPTEAPPNLFDIVMRVSHRTGETNFPWGGHAWPCMSDLHHELARFQGTPGSSSKAPKSTIKRKRFHDDAVRTLCRSPPSSRPSLSLSELASCGCVQDTTSLATHSDADFSDQVQASQAVAAQSALAAKVEALEAKVATLVPTVQALEGLYGEVYMRCCKMDYERCLDVLDKWDDALAKFQKKAEPQQKTAKGKHLKELKALEAKVDKAKTSYDAAKASWTSCKNKKKAGKNPAGDAESA